MSNEHKRPLYIPHAGPKLLEMPLLNKGCAFDQEERVAFNLIGLLPQTLETIEEQVDRAYLQYKTCQTDLDKHVFLRAIQDDNETLFFRLLEEHLDEMLPIIYTPTVGQACEKFSDIYRNHRGLFISYPDRDHIEDILRSVTKRNVRVIVVTDGERILGLGDQGIGGMGIPIGKLSLYSACGGISPANTLPIVLDVGTNNEKLLSDPMYMGWRHKRIGDEEYAEFVDQFIQSVKSIWPKALVQFEDFAQRNALPLLNRYRDELCCFNDDIQGTASVCVGSLLAACKAKNEKVSDQTIVFVGAGSAGCGIAEQIVVAMQQEGLTQEQARGQIYMIDHTGLLTEQSPELKDFQSPFAKSQAQVDAWANQEENPILNTVNNVKPTVMIGVSGQPGLFSQEVIEQMHKHCKHPFVLPLSNPITRIEAKPEDVLKWTNGEALVASGSPFDPVTVNGKTYPIAQCNNAYIFPGVGLGVIAVRASRVTNAMMMASSRALAETSPLGTTGEGALLPAIKDIQQVSKYIAFEVAKQAQKDGVALETSDDEIRRRIDKTFWHPRYRKYRRSAY